MRTPKLEALKEQIVRVTRSRDRKDPSCVSRANCSVACDSQLKALFQCSAESLSR